MIEKFIITNSLLETLEIELEHPEKTGIYVKDVTGLGYPNSNVSITSLATSDIGHFNQSIYSSRNVVFTFGFISDVEKNRKKVYDIFPSKIEVKVEIVTDLKTVYCKGIVETCEPNIFSKDETIQVSLICPNPYLIDKKQINEEFIGTPVNISSRRSIEQGYQIEFSSIDGIDNIKIEYSNGNIFYGSGEFKDPFESYSNLIGSNEKIVIDTDVNSFGIYKTNLNTGMSQEITEECQLVGDFPSIKPGFTQIKIQANGLIHGDEKLKILTNYKKYSDSDGSFSISNISSDICFKFNITEEECNYVRILVVDKETNLNNLKNDSIIGYIDISYPQGLKNQNDDQWTGDIDWLFFLIGYFNSSDSGESVMLESTIRFYYAKPRYTNSSFPHMNGWKESEYYSMINLNNYVIDSKGNSLYTGILSKYINEDFYDSFTDWLESSVISYIKDYIRENESTTTGTWMYPPVSCKMAEYIRSENSMDNSTYNEYADISDKVQTKVVFPNYHDGL